MRATAVATAMAVDTETTTADDVIVEAAQLEADEALPMLVHHEAIRAATRVGGEAVAAMMTAVTHAGAETATFIEAAGPAPAPALALPIVTTDLEMIATVGIDLIVNLVSMAEAAMKIAATTRGTPPLNPLKMNAIDVPCSCSNLQHGFELVS